jgi:hypothetical protein
MPVSNTACRIGLLLALATLTGCIGDAGPAASDQVRAMRASQDAPGEVLARNELTAQWTVVPSLRPSSISPDAIVPSRLPQSLMPAPELVHDFAPPPGSEAPTPINLLRIAASPFSPSGWNQGGWDRGGWSIVPSIAAGTGGR